MAQDDDEEIRHGAAGIIVGMLGGEKGVVQQRAVEMWYNWATHFLSSFDRNSDELGQWLTWISDLAENHEGYGEFQGNRVWTASLNILVEHDIKTLKGGVDSEVLFEVEPSNIFRDPLVDVFYASKLLSNLRFAGLLDDRLSHRVPEHLELDSVVEGLCVSPIDDAWEARRSLVRRQEFQRMIISKEGDWQESR